MKIPENIVSGEYCLEYGIPWQVEGSIHKENEILTTDDIVLEVGSGGSTIFYGKRCKKVISIETDVNWYNKVLNKLHEEAITNVDYILIEKESDICDYIKYISEGVNVISVDSIIGFNRSLILNEILSKDFDLRVIIMDNYGHKDLFPLHYDKVLKPDWEMYEYNHPEWWGGGTRLYIKNT
jgi:hypothetical protein